MQKLQDLINKKVNNKNIFGIALRVDNSEGETLFRGTSGNIELETQYFIASTTKIYTSAIIMKLIAEGLVSINDTLERFYDKSLISGLNTYESRDYSSEITIRQLLAHTSGIPDYFMGKDDRGMSLENELYTGIDKKWGFEQSIELAKTLKSKFPPGTKGKALYSDTNYQLLGNIIEIVRKKTITEVFSKEIFEPLGLKNTYMFNNHHQEKPFNLYYKSQQFYISKAMSSFQADGGIVSSLDDSMTYIKAFFDGEIFPKDKLDLMLSEFNRIFFPLQYGVGLMKFELPRMMTMFRRYPPLYGHSGLSGAFEYYCPEKKLFFTGTVNQIANPGLSYKLLIQVLANL